MTYRRIFCIVIDSLGVGALPDAELYQDYNVDTLGHIAKQYGPLQIPNLTKLGLTNLHHVRGNARSQKMLGYYLKAKEASFGKDTISGHYELMGLHTLQPYQTYTENGFPKELIDQLQQATQCTFIGNKATSGTQIIDELGAIHCKNNTPIIYTSADSVLQIAAHEKTFGLERLYEVCEQAASICMHEPYRIARVIARPFIGEKRNQFQRTSNRKDYVSNPPSKTLLNALVEENYDVIGIGKINDIFNGSGITTSYHSDSSIHGMEQTIDCIDNDFKGLCFTNLVDFDSLWGHRRDAKGYKLQLEQFDEQLGLMLKKLKSDDLLIVCADHGNDPTYIGNDHTREYIPILFYNKTLSGGGLLPVADDFCVVAKTIAHNFKLQEQYLLGTSYLKYIK